MSSIHPELNMEGFEDYAVTIRERVWSDLWKLVKIQIKYAIDRSYDLIALITGMKSISNLSSAYYSFIKD